MGQYNAPIRDMQFVLHEFLQVEQEFKNMPDYADVVYTGRWFAPIREAMDAFFKNVTQNVTGEVKVRLFKGQATALSATSPFSLFSEDLATFGESQSYDHKDSLGFIKLYGLPTKVAAAAKRRAAR